VNQYGQRALTYYQTYLPSRLAQIPDPTAFFETLGQEIAEEIAQLSSQMAAKDRVPGQTTLQAFGGEQNAMRRAQEQVMQDLVYGIEPEPGTEDLEPPANLPPGVHRV
jgi:hypothetical protein